MQVKKIPYLNLEIQKIDIYFEEKGSGWACLSLCQNKLFYLGSYAFYFSLSYPIKGEYAKRILSALPQNGKPESRNKKMLTFHISLFS